MLGSRTSVLCWGVDIGSGWVYPQAGSEPRAGVPWDIATMLCYKDAAVSGTFACCQPSPHTGALGMPWALSPAWHILPLHQECGSLTRPDAIPWPNTMYHRWTPKEVLKPHL